MALDISLWNILQVHKDENFDINEIINEESKSDECTYQQG